MYCKKQQAGETGKILKKSYTFLSQDRPHMVVSETTLMW